MTDTFTSDLILYELEEQIESERKCEAPSGCDREAKWWLIIDCGCTFTVCYPHKKEDEAYLKMCESMDLVISCKTCGQISRNAEWKPL